MNTRIFSLLLFGIACSACAQELEPASMTLTKGTLVFNRNAIVFRSAAKEERYPFPEPTTGSDFGIPKPPVLPGLKLLKVEIREAKVNGGTKDTSRIILANSDGAPIELVFGEPVEVFRAEVRLTDHRHLTFWRLMSQVQ